MPLLKLETTIPLPEEEGKPLLPALSKTVAGIIGKPEQYVMVTASHSAMVMSGKAGEAAFVDLRSIGGLNGERIAPDRVYLNFTDLEAGNWGWNGSTFG